MKKLEKISSFVLIFALLLSFASCKKEEAPTTTTEPVGETVLSTINTTADESSTQSTTYAPASSNKPSQTKPLPKPAPSKPAQQKVTQTKVPSTTANPWLPHPNLMGNWTGTKEIPLAPYIWDGKSSSVKLKFKIRINISESSSLEQGYFCIYQTYLTNYDECLNECKRIVAETNLYEEPYIHQRAVDNMSEITDRIWLDYTGEAFINSFVIQRILLDHYEESYTVSGNKLTISKSNDPKVKALLPLTLTKS